MIFIANSTLAVTIHSTTGGGNWNNSSTWIEGIVPGAAHDVEINGLVSFGSVVGYTIYGNECNDLLINGSGSIYNIAYGGGMGIFPLTIHGNCINNGTVTNGTTDATRINIHGDLTNNGAWNPYETNLVSASNQNLSLASGHNFGSKITRNSGGPLTALTDMVFACNYSIGTSSYTDDFDLNGAIFDLGSHSIDATGTLVYNGTLKGDFEIVGVFTVDKSINDTLFFDGTATVTDTLQANDYGGGLGIFNLKVEGDLINNGAIQNSTDYLRIITTGNIYNNGLWDNEYTVLISDSTQYLSQNTGNYFGGNFSITDTLCNAVANSDLSFTGDFDLNGATLEMQFNTITMQNWLKDGYLKDATLDGGYLDNLTCLGPLTITGTVTIEDDFNVFQDNLVVNGILQSNSYGGGGAYYDLTVGGDVMNNGTIKNINSGDRLLLYISGNLTNNGTWDNYRTYINGNSDQFIKLITRGEISGEVRFDANYGSSDFQWYFDDNLLDSSDFSGETSSTLVWNVPVPSSWTGTFYCQTNAGPSRNITVYNSLIEPENVIIDVGETDIYIHWDSVPGATSYSVYSSSNPYEEANNWTLKESGIADTTWSEPISETKNFYYVKAHSDSKAAAINYPVNK